MRIKFKLFFSHSGYSSYPPYPHRYTNPFCRLFLFDTTTQRHNAATKSIPVVSSCETWGARVYEVVAVAVVSSCRRVKPIAA